MDLSASCHPIKLFLYFLNLCNESESARDDAAPKWVSLVHGEGIPHLYLSSFSCVGCEKLPEMQPQCWCSGLDQGAGPKPWGFVVCLSLSLRFDIDCWAENSCLFNQSCAEIKWLHQGFSSDWTSGSPVQTKQTSRNKCWQKEEPLQGNWQTWAKLHLWMHFLAKWLRK